MKKKRSIDRKTWKQGEKRNRKRELWKGRHERTENMIKKQKEV